MPKRSEAPSALGMITGALGKFAAQQAIHGVVDKFAANILRNPEMREHLAQVMYEREHDTLDPWSALTPRQKEPWMRRIDCVLREIVEMTKPRVGM